MGCVDFGSDNSYNCGYHILNFNGFTLLQVGIRAVTALMYVIKPKFEKIDVDLSVHGFIHTTENALGLAIGDNRPDNAWLQFKKENEPKTQDDMDKTTYIDKTHIGYYAWPTDLKCYAPLSEQPKLNRDLSEMNELESLIYKAFSDEQFLRKHIKFLSIEGKKGRDAFRVKRFRYFKSIFRNFDVGFLPLFRTLLEELVEENLESSYRCASEIIAGMIRGSKHWSLSMINEMWDFLCPLLAKVFTNIMPEMLKDWAVALINATVSIIFKHDIEGCRNETMNSIGKQNNNYSSIVFFPTTMKNACDLKYTHVDFCKIWQRTDNFI